MFGYQFYLCEDLLEFLLRVNEISVMVLTDGFILALIIFQKSIDGLNSHFISSVDFLPCLSLYKERIQLSLVCSFFKGKIL